MFSSVRDNSRYTVPFFFFLRAIETVVLLTDGGNVLLRS